MDVSNEKIVSAYEAKKILKKRSEEGELNYEQKNAFEYLNKSLKLKDSDVKEMAESLRKIDKLQEKHIVSIIENLPKDKDDIRLLFANERVVLEDSEIDGIISIVKKYA